MSLTLSFTPSSRHSRLRGLVAGLLFGATALAQAAGPSFQYDGQQYSGDSLPPAVKAELFELEQQFNSQRRDVINGYIVNRYVRERAQAEGKSFAQLQQQLLSAPLPTDADVEAFYHDNKARIPGSLEQVREQIKNYLKQALMVEKQRQLLDMIAKDKGYQLELAALPKLRLPIELDGYPSKGNPNAPITLVEFADYQCPHCKNAGPITKQLLKEYGDKVRLVYRDFPINRSGISRKVAEAAVCADRQGQYWPFHELAFERQSYLSNISVEMLAEEAELDMDAFNSCLKTGEPQQIVAASQAEARELGINSTPTFFVNGRPLPHNHGDLLAKLKSLIDEELKSKN
ncbi:DsbA family protein [Motiliproteus sp.]|uniref:DsbA family protein n=1 Tax=Motiliproteus sp. TaxID=1898955 RepID=UPI003BA9DE82